jgi:hypothetical protein
MAKYRREIEEADTKPSEIQLQARAFLEAAAASIAPTTSSRKAT